MWNQVGSFCYQSTYWFWEIIGYTFTFSQRKTGEGRILIVQPRRVAARNLAKVASNFNQTNLGDEIGYKVRFDSRMSQKTKIIYLTDGMLFRFLKVPRV